MMKQCWFIVLMLGALVSVAGAQSAEYEVLESWGELPADAEWGRATSIATDNAGRILVFRRDAPFFYVLNPNGEFVSSWGEESLFSGNAHGVRVDAEGFVWATDNRDHVVHKISPDGEILMTLGQKGMAGDNTSRDMLNGPADVVIAPNGDVFVADGYVNSRVIQFNKDGEFVRIIGGTKGTEPGQFDLPHAVVLDSQGRLIVADSANGRLQVFDQDGDFVEEWSGFVANPRGGLYITDDDTLYISHVDAEAVTVMKDGEIIQVIDGLGGRPHSVTLDAEGNVYVANTANQMVKKVMKK